MVPGRLPIIEHHSVVHLEVCLFLEPHCSTGHDGRCHLPTAHHRAVLDLAEDLQAGVQQVRRIIGRDHHATCLSGYPAEQRSLGRRSQGGWPCQLFVSTRGRHEEQVTGQAQAHQA